MPCQAKNLNTTSLSVDLFRCDLCSFQTAKKQSIYMHIRQVHLVKESTCQECKITFQNPTKLKTHRRWHMVNSAYSNMDDSEKFKCSICNTYYRQYHTLQTHVEDFHFNEKSKIALTCDLCNLKFYSKLPMYLHMISEHSGPYGCFDQNCKKRFNRTNARRNHFKIFHIRGDVKDLNLKLKHLEVKSKDYFTFPYKCMNNSCEKRFKNNVDMLQHYRRAHSKVR